MNWFNKHINWTWIIFMICPQFLYIIIAFIDTTENGVIGLLFLFIAWLIRIGVTFWALDKKGRSLLWIFFPLAILFLNNKYKDIFPKDKIML